MTPPLPLSLTDRLRDAYAAWRIPEGLVPENACTSPEGLTALLDAAEPMVPTMECRLYPSRFDADDDALRGFPQPARPHWVSLERALRQYRAQRVMTRLPHFWQLESPIHTACKNVGAPLFVGEPENIPVGAAAAFSAGIDTALTEASDAASFADYLKEKGVPLPRLWFLIHRADAASWNLPESLLQASNLSILQEVHALPGIPILVQCAVLAGRKEPLFHISDAYLHELIGGRSCITSLGDDPLPLQRLELPFSLAEGGACACGKNTVRHG